MSENSEVTIIIVTYNSSYIINKALNDLINKDFRIIIVDNKSSDNLLHNLKKNYKNTGLEVVFLAKNYGFCKANNVALKMVKTKYALLLNPDAIIKKDSIDNLSEASNQDSKIALANPLFFENKQYNLERQIFDSIKFNNFGKESFKKISFVCGGAMLMRMKIFQKIGFLDENIFMYGDDDEISNRSIDNGYKNILVKNSYCFHANQSSVEITSKWHKYKMIYFRYWHQGWGKTYLKKRKKNIIRVWLKSFHRLFLSFYYLIFKFDLTKSIARFALFMGSISNLIGIDCFNKDSKNLIIDRHIIL